MLVAHARLEDAIRSLSPPALTMIFLFFYWTYALKALTARPVLEEDEIITLSRRSFSSSNCERMGLEGLSIIRSNS